MADIFISYSHEDRNRLAKLAEALIGQGFSVWWDREIATGESFSKKIDQELNAAKAVIVAWSEHSEDSDWVKDEASFAKSHMKLFPIRLDESDPPLGFQQFQTNDFSKWRGDAAAESFQMLLASLQHKINPDAAADASSAAPTVTKTKSVGDVIQNALRRPMLIWFIGIAVVLLAAGVVVWRVNFATPAQTQDDAVIDEKSIAVLPFANRSLNPEDAFFTDGVHDDLLSHLSRIKAMKVISRTSVMGYTGTDKKIPEIANELGVATILEGGVQRAGNQVRINVQLIDAKNDQPLWSEIYDRELTAENVFAIQTEIAEAITSALRIVMSAEETENLEHLPTDNLAASDAFMKGRQEKEKRTAASLEAAIEHFKRAITLDPDYALAYANLADAYILSSAYGTLSGSEARALAEPLAQKAVELDPLSGEAWTSFAHVRRLQANNDFDESDKAFERAIELNPNYATAYHWYGISKRRQGEYEEELSLMRKAAALDPLSPIINASFVSALWSNGRFDEAQAKIRANLDMFPEFPNNYAMMNGFQRGVLGRLDEAVRWQKKAIALNPEGIYNREDLVWTYLGLEDLESAKAERDRIGALAPGSESFGYANANIFIYERRYDDAVEATRRYIVKASNYWTYGGARVKALAASGDARAAKQAFETAFPDWAEENVAVSRVDYYFACSYAWTLTQTDEEAKAGAIARQALNVMSGLKRGQFGYSFNDVVCHAVLGDEEAALAALREAIDAGQRAEWWYLLRHPALDGLRERPEFQAAIADIRADLAEQRASLERDPD